MNSTTLRTIGFIPLAVLGYLLFQVISYTFLTFVDYSVFDFNIREGFLEFCVVAVCSGFGVYGFFMVGNRVSPLSSKASFDILLSLVAISVLIGIYMLFSNFDMKVLGGLVGFTIGALVSKSAIDYMKESSKI